MRTLKAFYNSSFAIIQKIVEMILSFLFRTVLIYTLGNEYLGLSGLFTNIFSVLSLMELGIGSAIVFLMYEPINNKDYEVLNAYLKIYSKFYAAVGSAVFFIGIALIPALPIIINDYNSVEINLLPIYFLTLLNVVSSYFLAHRRSLLEADQKAYINSKNYSLYNVLGTILRIVVLLTLADYNLTLLITLIMNILSNISIYKLTNKEYPFLKQKSNFKLPANKIKEIYQRMYAASIHQIGNIVVTSTDNIIISAFISLGAVGIYSNYSMLSAMIYSTFSLIFVSITSIVGNMKVSETVERTKSIFDKLLFLNFYLYFIACSIFCVLANDFITVWIGREYVMDMPTVVLVTISLYITGMRNTIVTFINSSGLNYNTRYKSIFEVVINLAISLLLVRYLGVAGVILGTIISFTSVSVWYEPYILFKYWFKEGLVIYYRTYIKYTVLTVICTLIIYKINEFILLDGLVALFIKGGINFIVLNIVLYIIFRKNESYLYYIEYIKNILNRVLKKDKNNV